MVHISASAYCEAPSSSVQERVTMPRFLATVLPVLLFYTSTPVLSQELSQQKAVERDAFKGSLLEGALLLTDGENKAASIDACSEGKLSLSLTGKASVGVGTLVLNYPPSEDAPSAASAEAFCDPCGFFAAVVTAVDGECKPQAPCKVTVGTRPATLQETVADIGVEATGLTAAEGKSSTSDAIGCSGKAEILTTAASKSPVSALPPPPGAEKAVAAVGRQLQQAGASCISYPWWKWYSGGRCYFTGCELGLPGTGVSDDCFTCSTTNGQGEGAPCNNFCTLAPDDIPGIFDFSDACCNHDYCFSTWYPKTICDYDVFYVYMVQHCDGRPWWQRPLCYASAAIYYSAVVIAGSTDESHEQSARYVRKAVCNVSGVGSHIPGAGVPDEGNSCGADDQCYGYCDGGACRDGSAGDPCATDLDCWSGTTCSGTCV